mmetsp:Transcript_8588/g.17839  ORF Transcript_8588/g.17839 Transcript_8588/m.17839 type:complete len:380 (-) Transcript_8588:300-1439(-)
MFIQQIQPPRILRIMCSTHKIGSGLLQQLQIELQLISCGRGTRFRPLQMMIVSDQFENVSIQLNSRRDGIDRPKTQSKSFGKNGAMQFHMDHMQLRIVGGPNPWMGNLVNAQINDTIDGGSRKVQRLILSRIVKGNGNIVDKSLRGEIHEMQFQMNGRKRLRQDVQSPWPIIVLFRGLPMPFDTAKQPSIMPKIPSRMHGRCCLIETIVGQDKNFLGAICMEDLGWNVEKKGRPSRSMFSNFVSIDPNATIKPTRLELQSCSGLMSRYRHDGASKIRNATIAQGARRRLIDRRRNGGIVTSVNLRRMKVRIHGIHIVHGRFFSCRFPQSIQQNHLTISSKPRPIVGGQQSLRNIIIIMLRGARRRSSCYLHQQTTAKIQ